MKLKLSLKIFVLAFILLMSVLAVFIFSPKTTQAVGFVAFGGKITFVQVCNTGFLITVSTPRPGMFMLLPTTRRFTPASLILPSMGQSILGLAGEVTVPCTVGPTPQGAGLPILMAGASVK